MADEMDGTGHQNIVEIQPDALLERTFIRWVIHDEAEELIELIRPILRKAVVDRSMTEEEYALALLFMEALE